MTVDRTYLNIRVVPKAYRRENGWNAATQVYHDDQWMYGTEYEGPFSTESDALLAAFDIARIEMDTILKTIHAAKRAALKSVEGKG